MHRYYYHLQNCPYAYGPTTEKYNDPEEVREMLKRAWGAGAAKTAEIWKAHYK